MTNFESVTQNESGTPVTERMMTTDNLNGILRDLVHADFGDDISREELTPVVDEMLLVHRGMIDALCGDTPVHPNDTERVSRQTPGLNGFVNSNLEGIRLFPNPNLQGTSDGTNEEAGVHHPLTQLIPTDVSLDDRLATIFMAFDVYRDVLHELVTLETRDKLHDSAKPTLAEIEKEWHAMRNSMSSDARTGSGTIDADYFTSVYHREWLRRTNVMWNSLVMKLDSSFTWLGLHVKFMRDSARPLSRVNDALTIALRLIQLNMHDMFRDPRTSMYHASLVLLYLKEVRRHVKGYDSDALHTVDTIDAMDNTTIRDADKKKWVTLDELRDRFDIQLSDADSVDSGVDDLISLYVLELFTGRDD